MEPGLVIDFQYDDPSYIQVRANNGAFAGETDLYINSDSLQELALQLEDFPVSRSDEAVFEIGKEGSTAGYCRLFFHCFDAAHHTAVLIGISSGIDSNRTSDDHYHAEFKLQFEAGALDSFVNSLKSSLSNGYGRSVLKGIYAYTQNINRPYT